MKTDTKQNTLTFNTTEAALRAGVKVSTIRTWCRMGVVAAVKRSGRWIVDAASLQERINLPAVLKAQRDTLDLSVFKDAEAAMSKAVELIEQDGIIPGSRIGLWFAVSSDGSNTYVIDTAEGSCTCKGFLYHHRCYHMAAALLKTSSLV